MSPSGARRLPKEEPGVLGIFVGGASRRMSGRPKGRLPAPQSGEPLVERLAAEGREVGLRPVLVGEAESYADLVPDAVRIADDPSDIGPLGGLAALLAYTVASYPATTPPAFAVACDMPYVDATVLHLLVQHPVPTPIVAPFREGRWEPLLARYEPHRVQPTLYRELNRGTRSFQGLFRRLRVDPLPLYPEIERALADWDTPEDVD